MVMATPVRTGRATSGRRTGSEVPDSSFEGRDAPGPRPVPRPVGPEPPERQHHVPVPAVRAAHLVVVQSHFLLGGLEDVFDVLAAPGHGHERLQAAALRGEGIGLPIVRVRLGTVRFWPVCSLGPNGTNSLIAFLYVISSVTMPKKEFVRFAAW